MKYTSIVYSIKHEKHHDNCIVWGRSLQQRLPRIIIQRVSSNFFKSSRPCFAYDYGCNEDTVLLSRVNGAWGITWRSKLGRKSVNKVVRTIINIYKVMLKVWKTISWKLLMEDFSPSSVASDGRLKILIALWCGVLIITRIREGCGLGIGCTTNCIVGAGIGIRRRIGRTRARFTVPY